MPSEIILSVALLIILASILRSGEMTPGTVVLAAVLAGLLAGLLLPYVRWRDLTCSRP